MMEVKEFVGASREEAVAKAQTHFGVGAEKLEVYEVPNDPPISGLAGRTLVSRPPPAARQDSRN